MQDQQWKPGIRRLGRDERERLQYAMSLMREKRTDEAKEELLAILQQNNKSVPAHLMLGMVYESRRMFREALEHFKHAMRIDPMEPRAHLLAGWCSLRLGDVEQAKALVKTALDLDPKLVGAQIVMAQSLERENATEDAMAHLEEALRLDPQLARARLLRSRMLSEQGKTDEATDELESFLRANPGHAGASVRLAMMHSRQGEDDKAIELLEAASKSSPDVTMIWTLLGRIKASVKDYAGAEKAFNETMRLRPRNAMAPLRVVEAMIPQRKFDQARELLRKVPRRARFAGLVHKYHGDIYAMQDLFDDAMQSYRASLLNSEGGDKVLKEAEGTLGADADVKTRLSRLQAAVEKYQEQRRERLRDVDWRALSEQLMPQMSDRGSRGSQRFENA